MMAQDAWKRKMVHETTIDVELLKLEADAIRRTQVE
jgi:hypothetical protein